MTTFHYNQFSKVPYLVQWEDYLQSKTLIAGVLDEKSASLKTFIDHKQDDILRFIKSKSIEDASAILDSINVVCGTLESGFYMLADSLNEISTSNTNLLIETNKLSSLLDWRTSQIIEQQRLTNLLLEDIGAILRIPEIQKERLYEITQGIKFLSNAVLNNSFYSDAYYRFNKALKIEPSDYFSLFRLGLIHMHSSAHLNIERAEYLFRESAKYAQAEVNVSQSSSRPKIPNEHLFIGNTVFTSPMNQAAESYFFAAKCCYITGRPLEAAKAANTAFALNHNLIEAAFLEAKALSAAGYGDEAAVVLEKVIEMDIYYAITAACDIDLTKDDRITALLEMLRQNAYENALNIYQSCVALALPTSQATLKLRTAHDLLSSKSFIASKKVLALLTDENEYYFKIAVAKNAEGAWLPTLADRSIRFNITELLIYERDLKKNIQTVRNLIQQHEKLVQLSKSLDALKSELPKQNDSFNEGESSSKSTFLLLLLSGVGVLLGLTIFVINQNMKSFWNAIFWLVGVIILCGSVVAAGFGLLGFLGSSFFWFLSSRERNNNLIKIQSVKKEIDTVLVNIKRIEKQ